MIQLTAYTRILLATRLLLLAILIITGTSLYMVNKSEQTEWVQYTSRPPRTLRLELTAPYDQIINASGLDTFVKINYKSNDNNNGLSMSPWQEPSKSPVIVSYGFPEPIFELPPSTFVSVDIETAHMAQLIVKPMLNPLKRENMIKLAKSIIEMLNAAPLEKVTEDNLTLEEVWLRMQLPARDMDKSKFQVGQWRRKESHGNTDFALLVELVSDVAIVDPAEQVYALSLVVADFSGVLDNKLERLRLTARTKVQLSDAGGPCTKDSYSCDIPDVRVYLDVLRKEKLIPLR